MRTAKKQCLSLHPSFCPISIAKEVAGIFWRYFIEAVERLSVERDIKLVRFRQSIGSVESAAEHLLGELHAQGILP